MGDRKLVKAKEKEKAKAKEKEKEKEKDDLVYAKNIVNKNV